MKITPAALRHAEKMRASATAAKRHKGKARARRAEPDEELGDVFSDLLGGLPIIGSLFGGGQKGAAPGTPAAGAAGPAPGMLGLPMPGGVGATIEQIRSIVQDALAGNRDIVERMQLQAAGGDQRLAKAADAITQAVTPQLAQARGGVQVQRLQSQATSEHRSLQAQTAREQLGASRHAELVDKLNGIARTATAMQTALGGGSVVADPRARNILNLR